MSFVGGMLGMSGGNSGGAGLNYKAASTPIYNPTSPEQVQGAYGNAQFGLNQQQQYLGALQGQNGIGNQANVYQQQQALAAQLQGVANGTGPNPALQQLQNTTGQNVQNQAALMASQRGTGANAGLLARQAAMQGANIQQQAVGQGAALSAQQQLAGLGMLQNQQGMLGNLATQQVGQQANAIQGYNNAAQQEQANLLNASAQNNQANVAMQSNINNANAGIANTAAQGQQKLVQGALGGIGSAVSDLFAKGGSVQINQTGPQSFAGKHLNGVHNYSEGSSLMVPGKPKVEGDSYRNDFVDAKLSPGEIVLPRHVTQSSDPVGSAARFVAAVMAKQGLGGMRR